MSWYEKARVVIASVDATLPQDLSLPERRRAVSNAYPWGPRMFHPYKAWCKAQREYLAKHDKRPITTGLFAPAPVEDRQ